MVALANATMNGFPMIQISGSSERPIIDLQQGDYEELDQMNAAKPYTKASYRVNRPEDIGIGLARAIRAAVSGRPGGVYLDLPGAVLGALDSETGALAVRGRPGAGAASGSGVGPARPGAPVQSRAAADHPGQGRGLRAGGCRHPAFVEETGSRTCPCRYEGLCPTTTRSRR
jgi:hypothetical protein